MAVTQLGYRFQQVSMPLARDELACRGHDKHVVVNAELATKCLTVGRSRIARRIDGVANDHQPILLDTAVAQHGSDRLRDRDHLSEGPVAERGNNPHLGIVDTSGHHGRHVSKARGEAAQHIRAAATMAVHDVWL